MPRIRIKVSTHNGEGMENVSCLNVCAAGAIKGYRRWKDEQHFINKD